MLDLTLRWTLQALAWVLRICTPEPAGRHRRTDTQETAVEEITAATVRRRRPEDWLDGTASPMIRPYVLTPAERRLRRVQRERRRALYLATVGIDVGPSLDLIHGGGAR
jgi:hypothetical protein